MNKDELIKKAKELLNEGNIEKAKVFIEEHKVELGDYYDKAKVLLIASKNSFNKKSCDVNLRRSFLFLINLRIIHELVS